jgi:hypothetical protein
MVHRCRTESGDPLIATNNVPDVETRKRLLGVDGRIAMKATAQLCPSIVGKRWPPSMSAADLDSVVRQIHVQRAAMLEASAKSDGAGALWKEDHLPRRDCSGCVRTLAASQR